MASYSTPGTPCSCHILTFLLPTLLLISYIHNSDAASKQSTTNTAFITASCNSTTYPTLCYKTLSPYAASVRNNPLRLCNTALTVTIKAASNATRMVSKLAKQNGITSGEAAVIKDCIENLQDSVYELKQSVKAMGSLGSAADKEFQMSNVKTWVSAAITDENTCMDGFSGRKASVAVKNKIRSSILGLARLTSNTLSLINHLSY
ncbi:hypothetical protein RJ639_013947 [Escallonia herrerae]|uniref:Pectinesterase inhibitor domain-containing protein n=1 Tax=Escallonia herrerae TaxID=1293975 RepID=A0AA88VJD3_9ASTE|nr:hypothetical protein RJ639_013947 [Escallonia herrerae]